MSFLDLMIRAVQTGAIYALIALGLNVVYSATNVFSFTHGDTVMVGGVLGAVALAETHLPTGVAFAGALAVATALGVITYYVAVRPTTRFQHATTWVISTLGVALIIRTATQMWLTREPGAIDTRIFPTFWPGPDRFQVFGTEIETSRIVLVPIAILVTALLIAFYRYTAVGRALGAVAEDREGARMRGIPVEALAVLAFALGGLLAGFAGFVSGPVTNASAEGGLALTLKGFMAVAIGGIPNIGGALAGAFVLALAEQLAVTYGDSNLVGLVSLGVLLIVLVIRPQGLFGKKLRTV